MKTHRETGDPGPGCRAVILKQWRLSSPTYQETSFNRGICRT